MPSGRHGYCKPTVSLVVHHNVAAAARCLARAQDAIQGGTDRMRGTDSTKQTTPPPLRSPCALVRT